MEPPRPEATGQRLVEALVRRLGLRPTGDDRFEGAAGRGEGRVFGGMLLAQGLIAAGRTVDGAVPHSLHASFLRPGRHGPPIEWTVERIRDGQQLLTRRAVAHQVERVIFHLTASFAHPGNGLGTGLAHEEPMPRVPPPEEAADWEDVRVAILGDPAARRPDGPLEVRECDPASATPAVGRPARRALWMRLRGVLPADPLLHAAAFAFASDRGLLSTAARPHGLLWGARHGASLDHALWLHRAAPFDDWVLYVCESPVAVSGRALVFGTLYARDGARIASVAQEGLIRARG